MFEESGELDFTDYEGKKTRVILTTLTLGEGTFGEVSFAYSRSWPLRSFAVKRIKSDRLNESDQKRMLLHEKKILYSIRSENIVKLLGDASNSD
jgi:serine/threonine protein kinase